MGQGTTLALGNITFPKNVLLKHPSKYLGINVFSNPGAELSMRRQRLETREF